MEKNEDAKGFAARAERSLPSGMPSQKQSDTSVAIVSDSLDGPLGACYL